MRNYPSRRIAFPSPFEIKVINPAKAQKNFDAVKVGHSFIFHTPQQGAITDRLSRLLVKNSKRKHRVYPLAEGSTTVAGMTFTALPRPLGRLACLVGDRALLREDEDTLQLCAVVPGDTKGISLEIRRFGDIQEQAALSFNNGLAEYRLEHPPSGSYEAVLLYNNQPFGKTFAFEVAGYQLAPLSATLERFEVQTEAQQLNFQLSVESYQKPFHAPLLIKLTQNEQMLSQTQVKINAAGLYQGSLPMPAKADSQLVLDITPMYESSLNTQVVIPGSRGRLQPVILNEFGQNRTWSTLPQPLALAIRGGYLGEGQRLETPVLVAQTITDQPELLFLNEADDVHLVIQDLETGTFTTQALGDVTAGSKHQLALNGCAALVTVGCFFGDRPFEGYTTFIKPNRLELELEMPERLHPRDTLTIKLKTNQREPLPLLVWACDRRLSTPQLPDVGLAEHLRDIVNAQARAIAIAKGFQNLSTLITDRYQMLRSRAHLKKRKSTKVRAHSNTLENYDLCDSTNDDLDGALCDVPGEDPMNKNGGVPNPRELFPESLYFGVTTVTGETEIEIPLGDSLTVYRVQAFAMHRGDWFRRQQDVVVDLPIRVDLELPETIAEADQVQGKLICHATSGKALVSLQHNGQPVSLNQNGHKVTDAIRCPAVLSFDAAPGRYEATIHDAANGTSDSLVQYVDAPGCFTSQVKHTVILAPGTRLDLESCDAVAMRVLAGFAGPTESFMEATADYSFLCCEQTAAKNLAAALIWLTSRDPKKQRKAGNMLRTGLTRQKTMFVPGAGFSMYPDSDCFSQYYGALAVRYIWYLSDLAEVDSLPHDLRRLLQDVLACADQAGTVYEMQRCPNNIKTFYDAYAAVQAGRTREAKTWLDQNLAAPAARSKAFPQNHQVKHRSALAVAAATYLKLGDLRSALPLCNTVFAAQTGEGRLYSTQDSIATVLAAVELAKLPNFNQPRRFLLNGEPCDGAQAEATPGPIEVLELLEGFAVVEITRWLEEDWLSFGTPFPVKYEWLHQGRKTKRLKAGATLELCITLPEGYQVGDLAHISLPPGICRRVGGGQVRRFSVDFAGASEIRVPVAVTTEQRCIQHMLICVRNMFEEERGSCAGLQKIALNSCNLLT